jgi:hypothetical protein
MVQCRAALSLLIAIRRCYCARGTIANSSPCTASVEVQAKVISGKGVVQADSGRPAPVGHEGTVATLTSDEYEPK